MAEEGADVTVAEVRRKKAEAQAWLDELNRPPTPPAYSDDSDREESRRAYAGVRLLPALRRWLAVHASSEVQCPVRAALQCGLQAHTFLTHPSRPSGHC